MISGVGAMCGEKRISFVRAKIANLARLLLLLNKKNMQQIKHKLITKDSFIFITQNCCRRWRSSTANQSSFLKVMVLICSPRHAHAHCMSFYTFSLCWFNVSIQLHQRVVVFQTYGNISAPLGGWIKAH